MSRRHEQNTNRMVKAFSMVVQFGLNMIVAIGIGVAIGYGIGKLINAMWVVIPFFFIGVLGGFTSIYKMAKDMFEDPKEKKDPGVPMNTNLRTSERLGSDLNLGLDLGFEQEENQDQLKSGSSVKEQDKDD